MTIDLILTLLSSIQEYRRGGVLRPPFWNILLRISQKEFTFLNIRPPLSLFPF